MNRKKRILYVLMELPNWVDARQWSYCVHLGLEDGFRANDIEMTVLISPWMPRAREIIGNREFDQVWINDVTHMFEPGGWDRFRLTMDDLKWLSSLAPVRLGFVLESLDYSDEEYACNPTLRVTRNVFSQTVRYLTHVVFPDEKDAAHIADISDISALWYVPSMPMKCICPEVTIPPKSAPVFFGTPYGERANWLQNNHLKGLLAHSISRDNQTNLPAFFEILNGSILNNAIRKSFNIEKIYEVYLNELHSIRWEAYKLYLESWKIGCAVVNLPAFAKFYTGTVYEGIALGRPVIAPKYPSNVRLNRIFRQGEDILLYPPTEPHALADHIRHILDDPWFGYRIAVNAREKMLRFHTVEKRVEHFLAWIETGQEPDYGENTGASGSLQGLAPAVTGKIDVELQEVLPLKYQGGNLSFSKDGDYSVRAQSYFLKSGYTHRADPEYYTDIQTGQIVWQPDVYPIASYLAEKLGCRYIVDIGCGRAQKLTALYPGFQLVGIDYHSNIEYCQEQYPFGNWIEFDLENDLPIPIGSDILENSIIICSDVIEHLKSPPPLIRNILRMLQHSPVAVLSTPERDLTRGIDDFGPPENPAHVREWNLSEFEQLLKSYGMVLPLLGLTASNDEKWEKKTILALVQAPKNQKAEHLAKALREMPSGWIEIPGSMPVSTRPQCSSVRPGSAWT